MKIYLILLVISGIDFLLNQLTIRSVIKEYELTKPEKKIPIEEKIFNSIRILVYWIIIIPSIFDLIYNLIYHEKYREQVYDSLLEFGWN